MISRLEIANTREELHMYCILESVAVAHCVT
jgi:hypothetical protein